MGTHSEYVIRHELYVTRRGVKGSQILQWVELDKIYHPATEDKRASEEFPRLTPSDDWPYWEFFSRAGKKQPFLMYDRKVEHRGTMARWKFSTNRVSFASYLDWFDDAYPDFGKSYIVSNPDGQVDAYYYPEPDRIFSKDFDRQLTLALASVTKDDETLALGSAKARRKAQEIRGLFFLEKWTPAKLELIRWDRLVMGRSDHSKDVARVMRNRWAGQRP